MLELYPNANNPVESALYDPDTGLLELTFSWDALLSEEGDFANARHIDALTIGSELGENDNVYEIEIHADDGPRDEDGNYIYSEETMQNEFTIDIGTGIDVFGETLSFGLTDSADGTNQLYSFQLIDADDILDGVADGGTENEDTTSSFTVYLADAETDEILAEIQNGDELEFEFSESSSSTLVIESSETDVESISIALDGSEAQIESYEPYALYGDSSGDLSGGTTLDVGEHTVDLTAYSENGGSGDVLASETFTFSIADELAVA